jgi:hypothetical protein
VCPHPETRPRNPKPAAQSHHRGLAARKLGNLELNYREKITLPAPMVNNPGYVATLSVFETCRRRGVEPWRYITDLLARARKGLPHFVIPLSA